MRTFALPLFCIGLIGCAQSGQYVPSVAEAIDKDNFQMRASRVDAEAGFGPWGEVEAETNIISILGTCPPGMTLELTFPDTNEKATMTCPVTVPDAGQD